MTATIATPVERPAVSRRVILALVLVAQFMIILDSTIVTVALPSIQTSLHFRTQLSLQWVMNSYVLLFGGFVLLGGRAGDLYGRRTLFVVGLTLFAGASLVNSLAQSSGMLVAGRAAQGRGAGLVVPSVLAIIVATFRDIAERTNALGAFSAVTASGSAVGLLLGGILTDLLTWRWIFLVNVPIGAIAVLLALRFVPDSRAGNGKTRRIDVPGAIAVTSGVGLLVFAFVKAQSWGWGSTRFALVAAGAVVLLLAFVAIELRSPAPLVRLAIFRTPSLSGAILTMFLFISGQYPTLFFPTLYMQDVLGYSPLKTGLAYLPWPVVMATTSQVAQRLIPRLGAIPTLVGGLALGATGLLLLGGLPDHGS
jgi:EmrB/QacA subfamily drug resistance transporter